MVSHNCGINYGCELRSDSIDELLKRSKQLDKDMLRWYIEDDDGKMDYKHLSRIHKGIMSTLVALGEKHGAIK